MILVAWSMKMKNILCDKNNNYNNSSDDNNDVSVIIVMAISHIIRVSLDCNLVFIVTSDNKGNNHNDQIMIMMPIMMIINQ